MGDLTWQEKPGQMAIKVEDDFIKITLAAQEVPISITIAYTPEQAIVAVQAIISAIEVAKRNQEANA